MLAQLSRRVRSSSTMRIWTLALAAGVSESGSVRPSGGVGVSGPEATGSAEAAAERIAVVSIARPCKGPPHGGGDHVGGDPAHTTRRRVQCRDRAHPVGPHVARRDSIYRRFARLSRWVVAEMQQLFVRKWCYVAVS